jgi:hypothetical protein
MGQSKSAKYYADNPDAAAKKRKYQSEYQSTRKEKAKRASRNAARKKAVMAGKVKKGDGKDVDHSDGNARNNSPSNLKVMSASKNRAKK